MGQKRPLTTDERVERGLAQLGKDIVTLVKGKEQSNNSNETIIESNGKPIVKNIINNYINRTESPVQIRKFNFIDVVKIIFCIIFIVAVVKILIDPMWFVDGFNSWAQFFHSI